MKFYNNLKIRTKNLLQIFIITIGFLFVVLYGRSALNKSSDQMINFIEKDQKLLLALTNMYAQGLQSEQATRNVLLDPTNPKARTKYLAANKDFSKQLENAKQSVADSLNLIKRIDEINSRWTEIDLLKEEIQQQALSGNQAAGVELLNTKETKAWRKLKD